MDVMFLGMVMEVREVHLSNAQFPIDVTFSGMATEVRRTQESNVEFAIDVTLLGMTNAPALPPGHWIRLVLALL
jgi:hypothetical protein